MVLWTESVRAISRHTLSGRDHCKVQGALYNWMYRVLGQGGDNSYQTSQGSVQELTQQKA